ncbi:dihydrodipicolinate reductase [Halogeometricum borinquense DSM 11551]|uniref:4-hydroxy-tetrahydrodipicolinate reductase n=1 Tax=Halogeometricum borinquense (strain ATCC 700274 / DSM 11551 / JCM 10706 / KCTC 4070 / PR3) TaxID=469382 RepID=E4NQH7_HALBP|nr:4-hydroxy-tetrahydrodipicolinate reductase [Halogeometricum borinquense]ADQ67850.1 dihydrodipicolinate reductase [Halogeometricum borinquense DSM 11551]ELY23468.1 dihydrodipicolinate reductase [Halogeometricum borinquense DSM 11551]
MAAPVRVAITGAAGRMGRELIDVADSRDDVEVVLAVNRSPIEAVSGVPVRDADDLPELLAETDPDVMVDFTGPESSVEYVAACAEAGVGVVVGTTGFDEDGHAALDEAAESVPLLHATNFSRGVAALRRAVREAVAALPNYDVEVTETHHNGKRDAPSGTANTLLTEIDDVRGESERVYGREGDQPRMGGEIGVHARRAGGVTGEHEVLLADDHQLLSLTHRAGSRGVFAAGALDAAVWLADRDAGRYDFDEVLDA